MADDIEGVTGVDAGGQDEGGQRYRTWHFGRTVGELSGELQHPPEALRRGRACILDVYPITEFALYDFTANLWVEYLESRKVPSGYVFGENFSPTPPDLAPHDPELDEDYADEVLYRLGVVEDEQDNGSVRV